MVKRVIAIVVTLMSFVALPLFSFAVSSDIDFDFTDYGNFRVYDGTSIVTSSFTMSYSANKATWTGDYVKGYRNITFILSSGKKGVEIGGSGDQAVTIKGKVNSDIVRPSGQQAGGLLYTVLLHFVTGSNPGYGVNLVKSQTVSNPKDVDITFTIPAGSYLSEVEYVMESPDGQGYYWGFGSLSLDLSISWTTPDSQKIIDNQNKNTDEIIANQDKNTDKFINGDGTSLAPDANKDLDNAGEQMGNLENDALGGKSDEEIANDVNSALSFDVGSLDSNAQAGVSGFFDGLLIVFGVDYQSLLVLSLSLGLAAFIIGRKYKAG